MAERWYIVRTRPRAEYLAAEELGRDGFEIFFPRVKSPHSPISHGDTPLFPGYLFLRCDPEAGGWPSFRLAHGVLGWLNFGGVIPAIPNEVVAELTRRVEAINKAKGLWQRFHPGEKVRVVSGKLESFAEIVEEAKSPQARAVVLLQFMGRLVKAQVPWESLRPVDGQPQEYDRAPRRTRGRRRWIGGFGPVVRPVG